MVSMSRDHETLRLRCAVSSGRCDQVAGTLERLLGDVNQMRDHGAPEDVLERYTTAITLIRQARQEITLASIALWKRVEA